MKRTTIAVTTALFALPACGPTAGSDGSGGGTSATDESAEGVSQEGGSSGVMSTDCIVEGQTVPDGAQFDTPDGCYTFVCEAAQPNLVEDRTTAWAGDLVLATQEQLDAQTCLRSVAGTLTLTGSVNNTAELGRLAVVGGRLEVVASEIETIALAPLVEVGAAIIIADNPALTAMNFGNTLSVFGDVEIRNNDALASLNGAQFIGQCSACGRVDEAPGMLGDARPVHSDDGADSGPDEGGNPGEGGQPFPGEDGGGADGADEPGGGIFYGNILIADNNSLTDIVAMGNLYFAWSNVVFRNNAALVDLYALNITEVQGDFEVSNHPVMAQDGAMEVVSRADVWGQIRVCGNLGGAACPE